MCFWRSTLFNCINVERMRIRVLITRGIVPLHIRVLFSLKKYVAWASAVFFLYVHVSTERRSHVYLILILVERNVMNDVSRIKLYWCMWERCLVTRHISRMQVKEIVYLMDSDVKIYHFRCDCPRNVLKCCLLLYIWLINLIVGKKQYNATEDNS